jgi:PST family polysaccharide transporter
VLRVVLEIGVFGVVYVAALFLIAGQGLHLYLDLFRAAKTAPSV